MIKHAICGSMLLCFLVSCCLSGSTIQPPVNPSATSATTVRGAGTENSNITRLKVDLDTEKQLQHEVDNGHQPWRLNPVDVAHATVVEMDQDVAYEDCRLVSETSHEVVVECKDRKTYHVHLQRLIRPDGIWTAVEIRTVQ